MSNSFVTRNPLAGRIALLAAAYAAAYLAAGWADLATTALALQQPTASEGNVYVTGEAGYAPVRAWAVTLAGGVVIMGFLLFAALNAGKVSETWLAQPLRSFGKFYVNPFASSVIDRSPLHAMSFVLGFVPLRLLAAANNLAIHLTGDAPLGRLVGWAGRQTTPATGFWLVMGSLFYLLTFAAAPLAAQVLRWLRR